MNVSFPAGLQLHARIFVNTVSFMDISRFKAENVSCERTEGWEYQPCDVAIMYGLANPPRTSRQGRLRNAIHYHHRGPIIVIESSILGRVFEAPDFWRRMWRNVPRQQHPYYRVGLNGCLGDDGSFNTSNSPPDRWIQMKKKLNLEIAPYRRTGSHVLLIGQVPRDASMRGVDVNWWLLDSVRAIRRVSDRPIVIRLHPSMDIRKARPVYRNLTGPWGVTFSERGTPLAQDLCDAWACVTYSSGAAVDALLAGVPPICVSPASLPYKICSNSIADIESPKMPERDQFFFDLGYSQWTPKEMIEGAPWRHLWPATRQQIYERLERITS